MSSHTQRLACLTSNRERALVARLERLLQLRDAETIEKEFITDVSLTDRVDLGIVAGVRYFGLDAVMSVDPAMLDIDTGKDCWFATLANSRYEHVLNEIPLRESQQVALGLIGGNQANIKNLDVDTSALTPVYKERVRLFQLLHSMQHVFDG
jgi:hypothetical protein